MRPLAPLAAALLCAACSRQDLAVYTVEKERSSPHGQLAAVPSAPPVESGRVAWRVPSGWEERPGSGMRLATLLAPAVGGERAEVSVTTFPGDAGGELANINRWRGQLGLPALSADELPRQSRRLRSAAGDLLVVDYAGAGDKGRMIGALLRSRGASWFFKLTGAERTVARAKPDFESFLASLHAR